MLRDRLAKGFNLLRILASCLALAFSISVLIVGLIFDSNQADFVGGPIAESIILVFALFLLFINEGYQVAVIKSQHMTDSELVKYPHAKKIRDLIFPNSTVKSRKLPNLFLGQSFLVVTATFLISQITTFNKFPQLKHFPESLNSALFRSGFVGVIVCVSCTQILPSITAQRHPKEFLEKTPLVYHTIRAALFIESTGVVHCTFLMVQFFEWALFRHNKSDIRVDKQSVLSPISNSKFSAVPSEIPDNGQPMSQELQLSLQNDDNKEMEDTEEKDSLRFQIKKILSLIFTLISFGYLCYNIIMHRSSLSYIHPALLFLIISIIYTMIFYCEAIKIAVVSAGSLSKTELANRCYSTKILDFLEKNASDDNASQTDGERVSRDGINEFLLGRQLIAVSCGFVISNIYLFSGYEHINPFLFFLLIGLGLPGLMVTMQICQLTPQIVSAKYTKEFLIIPGAFFLVYICTKIEKIGITESSNVLSKLLSIIYTDSQGAAPNDDKSREYSGENKVFSPHKSKIGDAENKPLMSASV